MQRCLLGASLQENFTHVHSQIQDTEVANERQLWRDITSRQSCRIHKRPLSLTRCLYCCRPRHLLLITVTTNRDICHYTWTASVAVLAMSHAASLR